MDALSSSILIFVVIMGVHFVYTLLRGGLTLFRETFKPMLIITLVLIAMQLISNWIYLAYS